MAKSIEYFIEKYGKDIGTKKFNAIKKANETKKLKYNSEPYKRLTKNWYIWKYGEEIGLQKFETFANKSAHTISNFINRYGEEIGKKKYKECIDKKNTLSLTKCINRLGEEDGKKFYQNHYKNRIKVNKEHLLKLYGKNYKEKLSDRSNKIIKTKIKKYGGAGYKDFLINKHGAEVGFLKYTEYKNKILPGICKASKESILIFNKLFSYIGNINQKYYMGVDGNTEYFLIEHKKIFFYDLCFKESKIIVEYNGSYRHPTKKEAESNPNKKLDKYFNKNITVLEKYNYDMNKIKLAKDNGFDVYIIWDTFSDDEILSIFEKIKNKLLNFNKE